MTLNTSCMQNDGFIRNNLHMYFYDLMGWMEKDLNVLKR